MFELEEPRCHDRNLHPNFLQLLVVHHSSANANVDRFSYSLHGYESDFVGYRSVGFGGGFGSDVEESEISHATKHQFVSSEQDARE